MKVLILYASAGQGHKKAAEAIHRWLTARQPEADVRFIDVLDHSSGLLRFSYIQAYDFMVRKAQWLWSAVFYATSPRLPLGLSRFFNDLLNRLTAPRLEALIRAEAADLVISTHFLPSQIAACLKRGKKISSRLVTVVTDFGVHPFWEAEGTDLYCVASESTRRQLLQLGAPAESIRVTGIPVDPMYAQSADKIALRRKLGIPEGAFTVLVVTGSFGIGPLEEIAGLLHLDCHVLVVCARNKALFQRLSGLAICNVTVYGFVNNMNELMAASDLAVTKPGGLSSSELLALGTVPVFISAIPGQEMENVRALSREGIGRYCRSPQEVREAVMDYKEHPEKLQQVRDLIAKVRKPAAVEEIDNAIRAGRPGPSPR